jgi:hypothetical protein
VSETEIIALYPYVRKILQPANVLDFAQYKYPERKLRNSTYSMQEKF